MTELQAGELLRMLLKIILESKILHRATMSHLLPNLMSQQLRTIDVSAPLMAGNEDTSEP
jgi:anthranilate phosphoribosyltransferase